ncbi:MAG: CD1871A family CXXC motif-containing protein [Oscillospiraceae bacterium]|nr:CD1871A family CXXC motif-containing protein [Oscillospiraceae bacterium]
MKRSVLTILLLAAAVVCIGIGVCGSEPASVLNKAIHICLECIGIG